MPEPRRLAVSLDDRTYPVWIGQDLLGRLPELLPLPARARLAALFVDSDAAAAQKVAVDDIAGSLRKAGIDPRVFEATGESSKDVATAERAWRWMATNDLHRSDLVVGFGGGVVTDLAGFAAATYHRGVPWIAIPTTLLGMVDASIGGKTGVNLPEGKNLVGAFHQPLAVIADVTMLETLPDAALATGMAEVIKHGLIARADLLDRIDAERTAVIGRDPATLAALVADAASVKVDVVSADERESGARMFLNYGHTLGHALESLGGFTRWTHGQAVAIGMMFAAHLAVRLGYRDLVDIHARALRGYDLPLSGAGHDVEQVREAMRADKKFDSSTRFVVLEDLGKPVVISDVPDDAIAAAYEAVR